MLLTLILPSILIASCSYSHIETVLCCWRSLKMKLIGGSRTLPLPPPRPAMIRSGTETRETNSLGFLNEKMRFRDVDVVEQN